MEFNIIQQKFDHILLYSARLVKAWASMMMTYSTKCHFVEISCKCLYEAKRKNISLPETWPTLPCCPQLLMFFGHSLLSYNSAVSIVKPSATSVPFGYFFTSAYAIPQNLVPAPIAQLVECPLWGTRGFDPGPWHTKVVKNGSSCSSLGTQTYGVELGLVDPVSG